MDENYIAALREASQAKGSPLTDAERAEAFRKSYHAALRARFLKVIWLAGYRNDVPERICAEYFDEYVADIPGFVAMLKDYEDKYGDPD